jgi:hypothetical protein
VPAPFFLLLDDGDDLVILAVFRNRVCGSCIAMRPNTGTSVGAKLH